VLLLALLTRLTTGYHPTTTHRSMPTRYASTGRSAADAAESCQALLEMGIKSSGEYWLKPHGERTAFKGWCDQDSFGGGWLVCYTDDSPVNMRSEKSSSFQYPNAGYRSDCMHYGFNEIMYHNHGNGEKAWFSYDGQDGRGNIGHQYAYATGVDNRHFTGRQARQGDHGLFNFKAGSFSGRNTVKNVYGRGPSASWSGHGAAHKVTTGGTVTSSGKKAYQLVVCDNDGIGLFMSGITSDGCYKTCDAWCNDKESDWYRMPQNNPYITGSSFKENGNGHVTSKKISVAIRHRTQECVLILSCNSTCSSY